MRTIRNLGGLLVLGSLLSYFTTASLMANALRVDNSNAEFANQLQQATASFGNRLLPLGVCLIFIAWLMSPGASRSR